jgi:aminoglycoside phosphotransferase (APT) family kinase protein
MTPHDRARLVADRLGVMCATPIPLGQGTTHLTFSVGPYVIRLVGEVEEGTPTAFLREATLLDRLQTRLPVTVPHPTLLAPDLGGMAYRQLPGQPLLDVRLADRSRLVDDLGALLRAMADIDESDIDDLLEPDPYPLDIWRDEAVDGVLRHHDALTRREREYVRSFARTPAPRAPSDTAFCHNDLGAEHLLVDETSGHLLGVLDWSDAALTDPCRDLGRLTRDLGADAIDRVVTVAGLEPRMFNWRLIEFHARLATLEDLSHGITSGDDRYLRSARAALGPLFETLS